MKNRIIKIFAIALIAFLTINYSSCKSNKEISAPVSYMNLNTTCLNANPDGSVVLRAWGNGASKGVAVEEAKRTAVYDIIFKGIRSGAGYKSVETPLLNVPNAYEKYQDYFEPFFSNGGEYLKFVKEEQGKSQRLKNESAYRQGYGVIVVVNVASLRQQLKKDGVLKN